MDLNEFAQMTLNVLENQAEEYVPTVFVPSKGHVAVISGIPKEVDDRIAIQEVLKRNQLLDLEVFFGVQSDEDIVIGHYSPGSKTEFLVITMRDGTWQIEGRAVCNWWTLDSEGA